MTLVGLPNYAIILTESVKCFGEVDNSHVEVKLLFLTFLLILSCCKDHANYSCLS